MTILEGSMTFPKKELERIAKLFYEAGNHFEAYCLVSRYTEWNHQLVKEYVDNGFRLIIKEHSPVRCVHHQKKYYVRAIIKRADVIFYWCEPEDMGRNTGLSPKTFREEDIELAYNFLENYMDKPSTTM